MMLICQHRVNSIEKLKLTSRTLGIEVDIRSNGSRMYVSHDAFEDGIDFEQWLEGYDHQFLIANVKEEGMESRLREILSAMNIQKWAFLDQSFPFLIKEIKSGFHQTMLRVSEFENPSGEFLGDLKPEWIWLDSFTGKYPQVEQILNWKLLGYKFMVVSPELQARDPKLEINIIQNLFSQADIEIDGVCTKMPELWK